MNVEPSSSNSVNGRKSHPHSVHIAVLFIALFLSGCSTPGPLTVTGKEFVYPRLNSEWLSPCQPAEIPNPPVTNRDFYAFVVEQEKALALCAAKVESIGKAYKEFLGNLPK